MPAWVVFLLCVGAIIGSVYVFLLIVFFISIEFVKWWGKREVDGAKREGTALD